MIDCEQERAKEVKISRERERREKGRNREKKLREIKRNRKLKEEQSLTGEEM